MPLIATEKARISDVIKDEYDPSSGYTRERVTFTPAATATYAVGTVLGRITATGKYVVQEASAADGSQTAAAVLIGKDEIFAYVDGTAATDTQALVLVRGPVHVAKSRLVMGASTDTAAEKQAVYDALAARGIVLVDQV